MIKTIKRTLVVIALIGAWHLVLNTNISLANFNENPPFYENTATETNEDTLAIAQNLTNNELNSNQSVFGRIRDFFGMNTYVSQNAPALAYIKMIVNWLLSLVSLVSLIMIIAAFYMIFFSKQEESLGKAKKMLAGVAVALVVMWLSRYIVSFFYDVYQATAL